MSQQENWRAWYGGSVVQCVANNPLAGSYCKGVFPIESSRREVIGWRDGSGVCEVDTLTGPVALAGSS